MTESEYGEFSQVNGKPFDEDVLEFLRTCALPAFPEGTELDYVYAEGVQRFAIGRPGRQLSFSDKTSISYNLAAKASRFQTSFFEFGDSSVPGVSRAQVVAREIIRHFGATPLKKLGACPA